MTTAIQWGVAHLARLQGKGEMKVMTPARFQLGPERRRSLLRRVGLRTPSRKRASFGEGARRFARTCGRVGGDNVFHPCETKPTQRRGIGWHNPLLRPRLRRPTRRETTRAGAPGEANG